jgi:hypothetical protein
LTQETLSLFYDDGMSDITMLLEQPQSGVMKLSIEHNCILNTFQLVQPGDLISFIGMAARVPSLIRGLLSIGICFLCHFCTL